MFSCLLLTKMTLLFFLTFFQVKLLDLCSMLKEKKILMILEKFLTVRFILLFVFHLLGNDVKALSPL